MASTWFTSLWDHPWHPAPWFVVLIASWIAAVMDVRERRIPNWLTGPLVLSGLAVAVLARGTAGLADASASMVLLALPFILLFLFAGGGAGDAKLMAGIGAWVGLIGGAMVLVMVTVAGGVIGVVYAVLKNRTRETAANMTGMIGVTTAFLFGYLKRKDAAELMPKASAMQTMPYGLAIVSGVTVATVVAIIWHL